jgi:flagellar basal body-associated protein FliL
MKKIIIIILVVVIILSIAGAVWYVQMKKKQKEIQDKADANIPININAESIKVRPGFEAMLKTAKAAGKLGIK